MSQHRPPAAPPQLPGYVFVANLGSGGFADVFAYEEIAASRKVAVKVLIDSALEPRIRQQFESEARLMGQLSSHPSIVTVFNTGIARDGRPYLVMEYCPNPDLGQRFRAEPMALVDALRTGVEIAGAVHTAHLAGILHNDIKPANILVTEYRRPVLSDFGIAGLREAKSKSGELSVPWAPPEFFASPPVSDQTSDVWALAATLYSLLAGRSPFEVTGGPNTAEVLCARIWRDPLPPIGRPDVPPELERVLAVAMSKNPAARYRSALEFARWLQQVQTVLQLQPTPIDVPGALPDRPAHLANAESGEGTRHSVRTIDPTAAPAPNWNSPSQSQVRRFDAPDLLDEPRPEDVARTQHRPAQPAHPVSTPQRRKIWPLVTAGAVVVAAAVAIGIVVLTSRDRTDTPASLRTTLPTPAAVPVDPAKQVPTVTGLRGTVVGDRAEFTWSNPDSEPGDHYRWTIVRSGRNETVKDVDLPEVSVPLGSSSQVCISVTLVRESGRASSTAPEACAP